MAERVTSYEGRVYGSYRHNIDDPWQGAPPWAIELHEQLRLLNKEQSASTYQGKNINSTRPAIASDAGYDASKRDQVVIALADGTSKTVSRGDITVNKQHPA